MSVVILCEKPSAARNFAKALGGMSGNYNGESYKICNSVGHVYSLDEPEDMVPEKLKSKYHSWDIANLPWNENDFSWKRHKNKNVTGILNDIKKVAMNADELTIATDVDESGEGFLLAWEIIEELNLKPKKLSRMYFDDESPKSIQKAFMQRKLIPDVKRNDEYLKSMYRSKWDYLSIQFTRIATAFGDGRTVLRQGRLKSCMIVLVGDQLKRVAEYKKIPFYQNRFRDENGVLYVNPDEPQFKTKDEVPNTYHPSDVVCDSKTLKKKAPPKLIDLATLAAKLAPSGFKAKEVLNTYQSMYEQQIVSYPRTEDKEITPEQFNDLLPLVDKIANLVGVDPSILTHRTPRATHVKVGGSHGANRPGLNVPNALTDLNKFGRCAVEIYKILATSYLAMLCEDYEYEEQKGHVKDYPKFVGSTNVPKKMGFRLIWSDDVDDDEDAATKGLGTKAKPFVHEGFPPKPKAPTMKWLMNELKKRSIGTGATRTSTYADITKESDKSSLLIDKKGKISFARAGEMGYYLLPNTNIGSLEMTAKVQDEMVLVSKGQANLMELLANVRNYVLEDIETMRANSETLRKEMNMSDVNVQKEKYEGTCYTGDKVRFNRTWGGHRFTDDECEALLRGDEIEVTDFVSSKGNTYGAKGKLTKQTYNGHEFWGFERTEFINSNASKGVPDEWLGHKFTDDEKAMLQDGAALRIDDAVSKRTGKKFSCTVEFKLNERGYMGIVPSFD